MPPSCLTVLAAIRAGEDQALREVLRPIGDDINGKRMPAGGRPHVAFPKSTGMHFARFAILTDPDRGAGRARLLFASVYDGTLEAHLAEMVALTSDLDAIWGRCEGYTGVAKFPAFIKARASEPSAYYIAFREGTAAAVRGANTARREREATEDAGKPVTPPQSRTLLDRVTAAIAWMIRAAPIVLDVVTAVARHGFMTVYRSTLGIIMSLDRYAFFRFVNRVTGNRMAARRSAYSSVYVDNCEAPAPLVPGDEIPSGLRPGFREDVVTQNQLTLVTVIEPGQVERVRAVMSAIDSYARRLSPAGSLIGISTIHFVRWLVIDEGRRLMMVSDYDGSWENYIDEFAEMILSGLDAIWATALAFPPDGARDLPAFKRFLRSHQVPAEVFFSAYPDETVLNIIRDVAASGSTHTAGAGSVAGATT
jgi:hypothetical protein